MTNTLTSARRQRMLFAVPAAPLSLCFALAACGGINDPKSLPVTSEHKSGFIDQGQTGNFTVIVECPPERGGKGLLHVYQSDVKSSFGGVTRLDVAVTKNGFEVGEFVTITPIAAGEKAHMNVAGGGAQVVTPRTELLMDLQLVAEPTFKEVDSTSDWTVNGLEPGVNYYVRLSSLSGATEWNADQVVRVQGPICPGDEPEKR